MSTKKKPPEQRNTYVALLRGINVGGNKKVPMADLKKVFEKIGYSHVRTILNSGNVIFDAESGDAKALTTILSRAIETRFGFPVPVIILPIPEIEKIITQDPFKGIPVTNDTRLYVTFLPGKSKSTLTIPYTSPDRSFRILSITHNMLCSMLDLSKTKTPDAMNILEKEYGKDITTRNWNTVKKISDLASG